MILMSVQFLSLLYFILFYGVAMSSFYLNLFQRNINFNRGKLIGDSEVILQKSDAKTMDLKYHGLSIDL